MKLIYEWPHDYGVEVQIRSPLKKDDAVIRVRAITREVAHCLVLAFSTSRKDEPEMVGVVSVEAITLARAPLFISNAGRPIFRGGFVDSDDGVILRGHFGVNCAQKLSFWLSSIILGLFELLIVIAVFMPENAPIVSWNNMGMVFAIPAIGVVGFGLTYHWQKRIIDTDREWVERELRKALVAHS